MYDHHGIEDEERPHLQDHDLGALMGELTLPAQMEFHIIREDQGERYHCEERHAEHDGQFNVIEHMDNTIQSPMVMMIAPPSENNTALRSRSR